MPTHSDPTAGTGRKLSAADYRRLMEFRTNLRRFLHWSEAQARDSGLPPAQHQLLLVIKGHLDPRGPTIGEVAECLLLRHHSAVGLVDRAVEAGLVERRGDADDRRIVRLALSDAGQRLLESLSESHLLELDRLADTFRTLWPVLADESARPGPDGRAGTGRTAVRPGIRTGPRPDDRLRGGGTTRHPVAVKRVYDDPTASDGQRVLVDRLWPRGVKREAVPVGQWYRDAAPSTELRRWYGHDVGRFPEFADRYRTELAGGRAGEVVDRLVDLTGSGPLTLLTATRDLDHCGAAVLAEEIRRRGSTRAAGGDAVGAEVVRAAAETSTARR